MKKLLTSSQIEDLSPAELISYMKELKKYLINELTPHFDEFRSLYKFLQKEMVERAEYLEYLSSLIEDQRLELASGEDSPNLFTVQ